MGLFQTILNRERASSDWKVHREWCIDIWTGCFRAMPYREEWRRHLSRDYTRQSLNAVNSSNVEEGIHSRRTGACRKSMHLNLSLCRYLSNTAQQILASPTHTTQKRPSNAIRYLCKPPLLTQERQFAPYNACKSLVVLRHVISISSFSSTSDPICCV